MIQATLASVKAKRL